MFYNEDLYEFDIALSYASEDSNIVHTLRDYIRSKSNIKIYDYQENKKLSIFEYTPDVLKKIYSNKKTIVIMFLSENYINKELTVFESQFACQHLLRDKRLIIIKLDDLTIAWLPDTKDFFDLYGNKKDDPQEIFKIGNVILEALNMLEPASIENLLLKIKNELSDKLPLYSIITENDNVIISNQISALILYREDDSIFLCEKCSVSDINPMPLVIISAKENEYSIFCIISHGNSHNLEKLSAEEAVNKLSEIVADIL